MGTDTFEGGCLCGSIRYRVEGAPGSSSVCFCRSCRLASGASPVAWVVFEDTRFQLLSGAFKTVRSTPPVRRSFCGDCGTPIAYQHDDDVANIELNTATLDAPERFPPAYEIWHEDRVSWVASDARLPRYLRTKEEGLRSPAPD
jgi:hypothetical protein